MTLDSQSLDTLLKNVPFTAADRVFVRHLAEVWRVEDPWLLLAAALCSQSLREGNAFFDLEARPAALADVSALPWPEIEQWQSRIASCPAFGDGSTLGGAPLVFAPPNALYFEKYYVFEQKLAALLRQRAAYAPSSAVMEAPAAVQSKDSGQLGLDFESAPGPAQPGGNPVERAAASSFFVITGGPGTGKTTLALRYLDRLLQRWSGPLPPRFATVAPTGKAAARLAESLVAGLDRLEADPQRKAFLSRVPCLTVHRLLGSLPNTPRFRRDARRPILFDAIVVDESSMIDLPLMLRLLEATPSTCQVLLLGDKDQLASVNVGSVLHDILAAGEEARSPLAPKIERLTKTYRFTQTSSIYRACELCKDGDSAGFRALLQTEEADFRFHSIAADAKRIPPLLLQQALERHHALAQAEGPEAALAALNQSIVLTPTRQGPFGSLEFNRSLAQRIRSQRELGPQAPISGQPIIVLENNYELELFNGDLGIVWLDPSSKDAHAYFQSVEGAPRRFRLSELPRHESAFALTIHKSQGSEFTEALTLFGPGESQLLTRELLYTAFSRARQRLAVFGNADRLAQSIERHARRATRLAELLSSGAPN